MLTHRPLLKKILIGAGIFVVLLIYTLAVWNFIKFIRAGTFNTMAQQANWTYDWASYHQSRQPQAIKNSPAQFFSVASRKYNLVAVVENSNEDWSVASLDYTFIINGQELESQTAFINPEEKRLVTKMGYEAVTGISKVEIKIDNIKWYRVENDLPEINFEVKEAKFFPATRQTVGEDTFDVPARVTWQAKNWSLFNFWDVTWQVVLMSGAKIVAVNELNTRDFLSLESRDLEVVWLNDLSRIGTVEIYPILNKLDFDNFKELYIEPGSDEIYKL
ncbi:MAG: hypothetical protein Q8O32_02675 [bacterium]|nr:hypothetical protein [bacterium]